MVMNYKTRAQFTSIFRRREACARSMGAHLEPNNCIPHQVFPYCGVPASQHLRTDLANHKVAYRKRKTADLKNRLRSLAPIDPSQYADFHGKFD